MQECIELELNGCLVHLTRLSTSSTTVNLWAIRPHVKVRALSPTKTIRTSNNEMSELLVSSHPSLCRYSRRAQCLSCVIRCHVASESSSLVSSSVVRHRRVLLSRLSISFVDIANNHAFVGHSATCHSIAVVVCREQEEI